MALEVLIRIEGDWPIHEIRRRPYAEALHLARQVYAWRSCASHDMRVRTEGYFTEGVQVVRQGRRGLISWAEIVDYVRGSGAAGPQEGATLGIEPDAKPDPQPAQIGLFDHARAEAR